MTEASEELARIDDLVDEISLGSARGGRRVAAPLVVEVIRELTPSDLPLLLNPPPVGSSPPGIVQIRHSHHLLARCLAEGHTQEHAALISGYSPAYISILNSDPAFAELLAYYQGQKEEIFVDVMERMKVLGLSTIDELQRRLETEASEFTRRELMEMVELLMIKGKTAGGGGPVAGTAGVNISVKFVGAETPGAAAIDITPSKE